MITRDQLKVEIDAVDATHIAVLYRIIQALKAKVNDVDSFNPQTLNHQNPLEGSVTFEKDIISPIDVDWAVDS